jgi:hypothetical protein
MSLIFFLPSFVGRGEAGPRPMRKAATARIVIGQVSLWASSAGVLTNKSTV